jgi:hypothetical protein
VTRQCCSKGKTTDNNVVLVDNVQLDSAQQSVPVRRNA